MTERRVTFAAITDGDTLIDDKRGERWVVSGVSVEPDGAPGKVAFTIASTADTPRTFNLVRDLSATVTIDRELWPEVTLKTRLADLDARQAGVEPWAAPPAPADDWPKVDPPKVTQHEAAVAAVEDAGVGEVLAEFTPDAEEMAKASSEDDPDVLRPLEDLDDLQQRTHIFLYHEHLEEAHGIWTRDIRDRATLLRLHAEAHELHAAGKIQSAYKPHVHRKEAS